MKVSIQGELGSNSHMAVRQTLGSPVETGDIVGKPDSQATLEAVVRGEVDAAVLPIENSLHGSVLEHYDLLSSMPLRLVGESQLRIVHNLIAVPGTRLEEVRTVLSHPVALSQCRRWFREHPAVQAMPFYDTAGSVREVMARGDRETAAMAPLLAAELYGGAVLAAGVEDFQENFTRFHLIVREADAPAWQARAEAAGRINKMSVALVLEHRPGSLAGLLQALAEAGGDLTKIESRPVPRAPWEYVFYVDLRFAEEAEGADRLMSVARRYAREARELGRYASGGS